MADITSPRNLNPRRRLRSYPRVIRRARHNSYRVKKLGDRGQRHSARQRSRSSIFQNPR